MKRSEFLQHSALASGLILTPWRISMNDKLMDGKLKVACQQYTLSTYFKREGKDFSADLHESMKSLRKAGFEGFEPSFENEEQVTALRKAANAQDVWATSLYVNSTLHEQDQIEASIRSALEVARAAKKMKAAIVVTNPSPIRWHGPENKNDAQIQTQARALDRLGKLLRDMGMTLAYHNHDAEMCESAREFHHMMMGTDPANVKLCLDAHWVYRGSGNSSVALFDIVKMYGERVVELHLRQSQAGTWTEVFGKGDIDYERLAEVFLAKDQRPHLVMEQAVEKGTPHTLDAIEAQRQSLKAVEETFRGFAS